MLRRLRIEDDLPRNAVEGGLMLPGLAPSAAIASLAPYSGALAYASQNSDTADRSTYTFSGMAIGSASDDRYVIVSASAHGFGGISSVTIGGISADIALATTVPIGGGQSVASVIAIAKVPTGTTATIVLSGAGQYKLALTVHTATKLKSTTPVYIAADTSSGYSLSVPIGKEGGVVIGVGATDRNTSSTWGGLTESSDRVYENGLHSSAREAFYGASNPTITWAPGSVSAGAHLAIAVFR